MFSANLLSLLHLCDPALPIGGFSHSSGLETYVQQGIVHNKETAKEFVAQQLSQNICHTDVAFASLAYDAAHSNDLNEILSLDETCSALKLAKEMRQASNKLGVRLLKIFKGKLTGTLAIRYLNTIQLQQADGHYCIAFGILAQHLSISKQDALTGFFYNAAASFITNCVKLIPLGQQDGQELLMEILPMTPQLVETSLSPDKERLGYCCTGFDIRCMQHEQLYSRLYMS